MSPKDIEEDCDDDIGAIEDSCGQRSSWRVIVGGDQRRGERDDAHSQEKQCRLAIGA